MKYHIAVGQYRKDLEPKCYYSNGKEIRYILAIKGNKVEYKDAKDNEDSAPKVIKKNSFDQWAKWPVLIESKTDGEKG